MIVHYRTCFSYATTAGLEAAIYRETGEKPYLPKMLAAFGCEAPSKEENLSFHLNLRWLNIYKQGQGKTPYFDGGSQYHSASNTRTETNSKY